MRVRTRLHLYGAVLPLIGTLAAVFVAGGLFHLRMLGAIDQGLADLAAIESVTLFDGPAGEPHLPAPDEAVTDYGRPLPRGVVAVYGPEGEPRIKVPTRAEVPARAPETPPDVPITTRIGAVELRTLSVRVTSGDGRRFLLWIATPLGELRRTTATFYKATLAVCAAMAVLLFGVQTRQARRLSGRLGAMTRQLPLWREGDYVSRLPADPTGDEVAELRDALEEASRQLEAARARQERLIANAAHEVQTPLACMRTLMDLALVKERSVAELREALTEARDEIDRLAALARNLLDLAAAGRVALDQNDVALDALIAAIAETFRGEASRRGLALETELQPGLVVRGDPGALRQALDNLVGNALKHTPAGGRVGIALARVDGGRARITVEDTGPGVREQDRSKIFEPFFRAARGAGGAGLGLSIAREIARHHGGDVVLLATGSGARFALELPLATSLPAAR